MKKYFAKYFPIDGEIKDDDFYFKSSMMVLKCPVGQGEEITRLGYKKVKLFLCSRDIQVGDKIFGYRDGGWNTYHEGFCTELKNICPFIGDIRLNSGFGKIIGEISPATTWIKEGDEFDSNEVKVEQRCEECYGIDNPQSLCGCTNDNISYVRIKCNNCNTYH